MNRHLAIGISVGALILVGSCFVCGYRAGRESMRPTVVQQDNLIGRMTFELEKYKDPRRLRIVERAIRDELYERELESTLNAGRYSIPKNDVTSLMLEMDRGELEGLVPK